jgi:hypothetical protein
MIRFFQITVTTDFSCCKLNNIKYTKSSMVIHRFYKTVITGSCDDVPCPDEDGPCKRFPVKS